MELFDAEGNLVEAYTEEEVQAKIDEAKTALESATGEDKTKLTEQLETLQGDLNTATEKLAKFEGKDLNFGKLREQKDAAEQALAGVKKEFDDKLNAIKGDMAKGKIEGEIEKRVGAEPEIKSKVRFFYDSFKGEPANDEEINKRLDNAVILATGGKPINPLSGPAISGAGGYVPKTGGSTEKLNPEAKGVADKLGITDEELKENKLI